MSANLEAASGDRADPGPESPAVLAVDGLCVEFAAQGGADRVIDGLSLSVNAGETVGLVGESGCGKSLTALAVMGLLPRGARIAAGRIGFAGRDLARLTEPNLRRLRGDAVSMVFQEPMSSLNPLMTIGRQIGESLRVHRSADRTTARARALDLLELVRVPDARTKLDAYPHQLSGGMRQRVMIAIALACEPRLLIADEPTTALDVTIQAQILALLQEAQQRIGMGVLLITHDLGIVAETCDRVVVMYAGRKAEEGTVAELFDRPRHPYTRGLLASAPRLDAMSATTGARLAEIAGSVPALADLPAGCRFAPRCPAAMQRCVAEQPPDAHASPAHRVACWRWDEAAA